MLRGWWLWLAMATGCKQLYGLDSVHVRDGGADGSDAADARLDGAGDGAGVCFGDPTFTGGPICVAMPTGSLVFSNQQVSTDTDCTAVVHQSAGQDLCVIAGTSIAIGSGAKLTAVGSRPLVLLATAQLDIAGTIDVSSHDTTGAAGASFSGCSTIDGASSTSGGSGGAGGSFTTSGGAGGAGGLGTTVPAAFVSPPGFLRGGCAGGQGGRGTLTSSAAGGAGGGAVYLIAGTMTLTGTINASGAGGGGGTADGSGVSGGGGGGGGSGGMIVLYAQSIMTVNGSTVLFANGGGGGGGAGGTSPGMAGNDATSPTAAAFGGSPGSNGGFGGNGYVYPSAAISGVDGGVDGGGGGGGGGAGSIRVLSGQPLFGTSSPQPTG